MREWTDWYRNLIIAWVVIGLPSVVIGYGMAGGVFEIPGREADLLSTLVWLLCVMFLLSPVLLWPLRKRRLG